MTIAQSQEFQFFVLNTKVSWEQGEKKGTEISDAGLILESKELLVQENRIGSLGLEKEAEIDLTVGDCDLLCLADAVTKQIWVYDASQRQLEHIYKIPKDLLKKPTNIAYSRSNIYIIDETSETETILYAFGRNSWKPRWGKTLNHHHKVSDLVADRSGNTYILLRDGDSVIEQYNADGNLVKSIPRANIEQPIAIAVQEDDRVNIYILNSEQVVRLQSDDSPLTVINFRNLSEFAGLREPRGLAVDRAGNIYIGDGTLIGNIGLEDSRFIYRFSQERATLDPVLGYRGGVSKLAIDPHGTRLYVFNDEVDLQVNRKKQELIILRLEKQFQGGTLCQTAQVSSLPNTDCHSPDDRVPPIASYCNLPRGIYYSQAFDSTQAQMRWHKLVVESKIPENTRIEIFYVTSDRREQIDAQIKAARSGNDLIDWSIPIINPTDALLINQKDNIESPSGHYLWLKIELIGSPEKSPIIKSIRVYFPRLSYLRYLPATYQEDLQSRDFLERFLSLFETSLLGIEWQIDRIARYFDADSTGGTGEFLRWLATWLAIAAENNWKEPQLRQLVKAAPQLYRQRGTKAGLELLVQIFTGDRPIILEYFRETIAPAVAQEQQKIFNQLCGEDPDPFCFCILLSSCQGRTDEQEQIIKRLIDREKPAHTEAVVYTFKPLYRLGDEPLYLGINAYIARDNLPRLGQGTALSSNTILIDEDDIERFR
jgi:phage tail-like protein